MSDYTKINLSLKLKESISLIKDIDGIIKSFKSENKEFEIREQLRGITKTISAFEQKNLTVPSELRNLKASLFNSLSEIEEADKIISEFYNALKSLLNIKETQKPETKPSTTKQKSMYPKTFSNVKLSDVVSSGLLPPNTKIIHRGRDTNFIGTITQDGRILCLVHGANKFFDTPSGAAEALAGGSKNGWDWWFIQQGNKLIPLAKIRDQYLNNNK